MMEISQDILSINGIFISAKAKYGDMTKIMYKGLSGEDAVLYIQQSLKSFLKTKNLLDDDIPKQEYKNYFEDLSLLLLVNCRFSTPLKLEEYEHFTFNFPKLSKYLVAKVMVKMELIEYFCAALEKLPLIYSCEMFTEFPPTVDKIESHQILKHSFCILNAIGNIYLKNREFKFSDEMDILLRNVPDFFFYITRLSLEDAAKLRRNVLYKRAGFVLEKLFDLLFFCHKNVMLEGIFIDKLIDSTVLIIRAVSLDMFLHWAEIDEPGGGNLQTKLSGSAYYIIEKYQNYTPAKDLIVSLKPFAIKPKNIKEQIHTADLDHIVNMVNKADENQRKWFQALIFSSFFSNHKAIECVEKWSQLCDEEDVSRLLNEAAKLKDEQPKKVALKCASSLNLDKLIVVVIRHFYNNSFVILNDNQQEMILWFNKLKASECVTKENHQELLLFILENPNFAVNFILTECIKSEFYISSLFLCFLKFKDIWKVHDICLNNLNKLMISTPPSTENSIAYKKLIETLFRIELFTFELFSDKLICPFLEQFLKADMYEEIKQLLMVINYLELQIIVGDGTKKFFEALFEILLRRTNSSNYNSAVQNAIQEVVHLIMNKTALNQQIESSFFADYVGQEDVLNFYIDYLCKPNHNIAFLQYSIGIVDTDKNTTIMCQLMKVLPFSVQSEWILICSELIEKIGVIKLIETLRDMIILLCDFARTQENKDTFQGISKWLKYTIRQFGYILKAKILPLNNDEIEILITQSMVTLMSHFPETLKETEGLNIIHSLMTNKSLKKLGNDKCFISNICSIKNSGLCQVIASKIIE